MGEVEQVEAYLTRQLALAAIESEYWYMLGERWQAADLLHWLAHYNIACILVITKADKLSKNKQTKQVNTIIQALGVAKDEVILFSAKTRLGKDAVWEAILALLEANSVT